MANGKHMESARSLRPLSQIEDGSVIASPDRKLEVLSHQRLIDIRLEQLLNGIREGNTQEVEQHALAIQESFAGVKQYLSLTIQPKYYGQHRPHNTQIAEKVFAIPELTESILTNLEVLDLMRCYEVNRTFRDSIENSKKLQTCLFLRPDPKQLNTSFPLRTKYIRGFGQTRVTIRSRTGRTYSLGSRWKRMLVRQPPIYKMMCRAECEPDRGSCELGYRGTYSRVLTSEYGLTLGELFKAVQEMVLDHRAHCGSGTHKMVNVTFDGPKN